jgi:hypothetical protein
MNNDLKKELNDCKKECDRRFDIHFETQERNDDNHYTQQKYIVEKLIKLNKLFNESDYNDDEFITITVILSLLYDTEIDYACDEREIKIFKNKLGIFNNISIFLSKYGHIVYQLDGKYYYDIYICDYAEEDDDIIQKKWYCHIDFNITPAAIEYDSDSDEYITPISKKYKEYLTNFLVIDSNMELSKFFHYIGKHVPLGLSGLYKQLTYMENLFFDKMNDKMKLLDEVIEMNRKLIDIKL